jgi:hypothetical protein
MRRADPEGRVIDPQGHASEKWIRLYARHDSPGKRRSIVRN